MNAHVVLLEFDGSTFLLVWAEMSCDSAEGWPNEEQKGLGLWQWQADCECVIGNRCRKVPKDAYISDLPKFC